MPSDAPFSLARKSDNAMPFGAGDALVHE